MEKKLNIDLINAKLESKGFNQASLSKTLHVSRESVSQWLKNGYFPDPKNLLKLGQVLGLSFNELVIKEEDFSPLIEFRKTGSHKINDEHFAKAKNMGECIELLIPYFNEPFLTESPILLNPVYEYEYILQVTSYLRNKIEINEKPLAIDNILFLLKSLQAVVIPVLWGKENSHRNSLHIFLPKSKTTWVFFNLDSFACDSNFWLSHELGHIISKKISPEVKEKFAEDFAEALLFPIQSVKQFYEEIINLPISIKINKIKLKAGEYNISPVTIYSQLKKYSLHFDKEIIDLGKSIYPANTVYRKEKGFLSDMFFGNNEEPTAESYINITEIKFKTPIFKALRNYNNREKINPGFIQQLFDISTIDSINLFEALNNGAE